MDIKITGKHIDISPEIKSFIEKEMSKLEKYDKHILNASCVIELNEKRYNVEMEMHIKKHVFTSSDESYDLMSSIDNAVNKLKKQLKKYEEKKHEHKITKQ